MAVRASAGGVLMGLANLVPGISGGTMLVATGVYTRFIAAVAEITTFRFRTRSLLLLGFVGGAALVTILLLAGSVKGLVADHRWIMYSLFIGLTLGGVPLVWRMARPGSPALLAGALAGLVAMGLMTFGPVHGDGGSGWLLLFVAGVAGSSAMILPGVSGAYLLLLLGQYQPILGAIDQVKQGQFDDALGILLPVGAGVVAGIAGVSNLLGWALRRYEQATLGVLLGLLLGSVLGLWPFQHAVEPGAARSYYTPGLGPAAFGFLLVAAGFGVTLLIDYLGRRAE